MEETLTRIGQEKEQRESLLRNPSKYVFLEPEIAKRVT